MTEVIEERRSEDAAETRTVSGWVCRTCERWWGDDERMARYCCSQSFPCECGSGRYRKGYSMCQGCRSRAKRDAWYAKPAVDWDGEFPIALWDDDTFFWNADELLDYFELNDVVLSSLWLTSCRPDSGRTFDMNDYLCDSLPEDTTVDAREIDKIVNDWIEENAPFCWWATGDRLSISSISARRTDFEAQNGS